MKEKSGEQSAIMKLAQLAVLAAFLLPGFDHRYSWSDVPLWLALVADGLVLLCSCSRCWHWDRIGR